MNHMKEVAKMFGMKLGEEFRVVSNDGLDCICRFGENKILEVKDMRGRWVQNYSVLSELLIGRVKIMEDKE